MSIYEDGIEVALRVDLTHYHPSLKPGVRGTTTPPAGYWANLSNKFVSVKFEDVTTDVQWRQLETTDSRVGEIKKEEEEKKIKRLKEDVKQATLNLGSRDGFRNLRIEYSNGELEIVRKRRLAEEVMEVLRDSHVGIVRRYR
jgi:hypothetical protein